MMSGPAPSLERIQQLETIEKDVADAVQAAGKAVEALSMDKLGGKTVDLHTQTFLKKLEQVESNLSHHINYLTQVSTSQPHEGSSYAAQKDLQMAFHRLEHVRSRLAEMDRWRHETVRYPQGGASAGGWAEGAAGVMQLGLQRSMSQEMPQRSLSMQEHGAGMHMMQQRYPYMDS